MPFFFLKRRLNTRPMLLAPYRSVSVRQARSMWRKTGRPGFQVYTQGAREALCMTQEQWDAFVGAAPRTRTQRGVRIARRNLAIALALVVGLALFFTATPQGRTLAADLYRLFLRVTNQSITLSNQEVPSEAVETRSSPHAQEAHLEVPRIGFVGEGFVEEEFVHTTNSHYGTLMLTGLSYEELHIDILQSWHQNAQQASAVFSKDEGVYTVETPLGLTFYGTYTDSDRTYHFETIHQGVKIKISFIGESAFARVEALMQCLDYVEAGQ